VAVIDSDAVTPKVSVQLVVALELPATPDKVGQVLVSAAGLEATATPRVGPAPFATVVFGVTVTVTVSCSPGIPGDGFAELMVVVVIA
jgi:hypothetical protein